MAFFAPFLSLAQNSPNAVPTGQKVQGILMNADSSDRDLDKETIELNGNVQVIFKEQHLKADFVRIYLRSKIIEARGRVFMSTPEATYGGDRLKFDYESNTGIIYDGYVQSNQILIEGKVLQKIGPAEFIATDARYTSCKNCPETWSFSGTTLRAELGGYAYIKNSVMKVTFVPIFWLPYLILPLKSDRQTGLLTPEGEYIQDSGIAISDSYFWAINRSSDATFTLKNYELRGPKELVNYRYYLSERSSGEFDAGTIQDKVFATNEDVNLYRSRQDRGSLTDRWFIKYQHYYDLPEGFTNRIQVNTTSDLKYPRDFTNESLNPNDPALENRVSVTHSSDKIYWGVDSSYYVNMLQSDPMSTSNDSVHRMPEVRISQRSESLWGKKLFYNLDFVSTQFSRSGFGWDEMDRAYNPDVTDKSRLLLHGGTAKECAEESWEKNRDCSPLRTGRYDSAKDIIRAGQRVDGQGSLFYPLKSGPFDFLPQISYRETRYSFPVGEDRTNTRQYLKTQISTRTTFSGFFGGHELKEKGHGTYYKHQFQPEVTFTTIPWIYHPAHPFFGNYSSADIPFYSQENITDSDINGPYGIQFDYSDRLYDRKIITFGFTNKIIQKKVEKPIGSAKLLDPAYNQFLTWRISQSYDFFQAESRNKMAQAYSDISSELRLNLEHFTFYQLSRYYPYQSATNSSTNVTLSNDASEFITLGYNSGFTIEPGKRVDYSTRSEEISVFAKKSFIPLDALAKVTYDLNPYASTSRVFKSYGYGVQINLPGDCWKFTFMQYQNPIGLIGYKVNFAFSWDGKPVGPIQNNILDQFGI